MAVFNGKLNDSAWSQWHLAIEGHSMWDRFEETTELSLEYLGCISGVNTRQIHSKKASLNQNHTYGPLQLPHHLAWLLAISPEMGWGEVQFLRLKEESPRSLTTIWPWKSGATWKTTRFLHSAVIIYWSRYNATFGLFFLYLHTKLQKWENTIGHLSLPKFIPKKSVHVQADTNVNFQLLR